MGVAPNGRDGYEYSDGSWRKAAGAIVFPAPKHAMTRLNANRFQKASVKSRLNRGRCGGWREPGRQRARSVGPGADGL